jgi:hypothetical protein
LRQQLQRVQQAKLNPGNIADLNGNNELIIWLKRIARLTFVTSPASPYATLAAVTNTGFFRA